MIVKTTKPNRSCQALYVYTDTSAIYILPLEVALKLHFRPGNELTDIPFLETTSLQYLLKEYALRQIAISPKSRHILSQKLTQKLNDYKFKYNYSQDISISEILDYLEARNLLDASSFARHIVFKNRNKSSQFISQKLKQQKLSSEDVSEAMLQVDLVHQRELLQKLIAKLKIKYQKQPLFVQKQKILSSVYQKGFSVSQAKNLLDQD
jgi:SOS response regulatory protein OraA/RecX